MTNAKLETRSSKLEETVVGSTAQPALAGEKANGHAEKTERVYDLAERTAVFKEQVIRFARGVRLNAITQPLVRQLVRSATSVGANYLEANDSESQRDLRHKLSICRKESRETTHWLRMLVASDHRLTEPARVLWREASELNRIFASIVRKIDRRTESSTDE